MVHILKCVGVLTTFMKLFAVFKSFIILLVVRQALVETVAVLKSVFMILVIHCRFQGYFHKSSDSITVIQWEETR